MAMLNKVKLTSFGTTWQLASYLDSVTQQLLSPHLFQTHTLRQTTKGVFPYGARSNICYYAQQDEVHVTIALRRVLFV